LFWRIRRMSLKPESIGAKLDLVRPIEAASSHSDADLREERGIGEGRKHALAEQMIETTDGRRAIHPMSP
jgi:hypothetical protein